MESSTQHVICISNGEENNVGVKEESNNINKTSLFEFYKIISRLREKRIIKIEWREKGIKIKSSKDEETRRIIHSVKVGISLVLVSLFYLLNPLFEQVGENAMWAIMTVVVIFEFSAGATLGKGFNRGIGTILGGGLGCIAAILAQYIGGVGNSIIIGTAIFISGSVATYVRQEARIKQRYDYGVMIFILTFNLVVVSVVRADESVWEIARQRLLTIVMGFIVCICVSLLVFPLWASDQLHDSTVSTFFHLANTIQSFCFHQQHNHHLPHNCFTLCNSILNSKSKNELLANFAKWEPWHGKFGFSYPWDKYLKIGEGLRELAAFILAVGRCLQASKQAMESLRQSPKWVQIESWEVAIGSKVSWALTELGESMKQMRKFKSEGNFISAKMKAARTELSLVISTSKISELENDQVLAIASFVLLLNEVLDKVEDLVKQVEELGDIAHFNTHDDLTSPTSS